MKKVWFALASLLAASPASAGDDAATPVMAEVVVTATRSGYDATRVPARVEVIDSSTVELTTGDTLTEQLKKNSSVDVIEYPGALAGIGIRGFRPEFSGITKHSLVLVNGRPAGATNLAALLADNIERIEVLKGPASSLYGAEAMGGVVNIITKKSTGPASGMVEAGLGSFATNFQKFSVGGSLTKALDLDVHAGRYDRSGDYDTGDGRTRANTTYETENGGLRLGIDMGGTWRADAAADFYRGRDIETPGDIFYGDSKAGYKDLDRYGLDLTVGGGLGPHNRVTLTVYKANETSENYKRYTGWSTPVPSDPYRSYDSEIDWFGLQLRDELAVGDHRIIAGFDYQEIDMESRSYKTDGTRKAPYSPDEGRTNRAGYVETVWSLGGGRLTVTAGGRYDSFDVETRPTPYKTDFTPRSEGFSTFSPRAGLSYLLGGGLRLHATAGRAFVPPTAAQLAGYSERVVGGVTMVTTGNAGLDPESSVTYDAGLGYHSRRLGIWADVTYFRTSVDDKITTVTSGYTTTYVNSLSAEMEGVETDVSFDMGAALDWERSLSLFVNSTHMLRAEEERPGGSMRDIHNVARYTINYGIRYEDEWVEGKLHLRSRGSMKDTDWNAPGYPEIQYPSFTVVDLVVAVTLRDHHRLTFKADNLFDRYYYEKKGYPKQGRALFAGYRYVF
ncbi:MAG TPA: TonB-dependent receptor [Deltaproteobacteria bacterium]|nr:TonB-dependent receptor [Deltaproteobacteria bacterium]